MKLSTIIQYQQHFWNHSGFGRTSILYGVISYREIEKLLTPRSFLSKSNHITTFFLVVIKREYNNKSWKLRALSYSLVASEG